jgi:hypothetical protein
VTGNPDAEEPAMSGPLPATSGWIDPRGHRFGAATAALILGAAFVLNAPWLVAVVLITIGASAALGMRYSVYRVIWRQLVRTLRLPKVEPEHPYPPRFAQSIGSIVLIAALISFVVGLTALAWLCALAVAALQTLLAVTGVCLGCRMYFIRWWVPALFARWWQLRDGTQPEVVRQPIQFR